MTLRELHALYIETRGHELSTNGLPFREAATGQADYIKGEANELCGAVKAIRKCCKATTTGFLCQGALREVRKEIADVVLATVTLANILGVTVEDCIAEKTAADRGRG